MLQSGRSSAWFLTVSLEFFSDIILLVVLWPWGQLSLWQKWVPGVFSGGKGGQCIRLTTLPPSCAVVMTSGNLNFLEPSGPPQACNGTALPFTFNTASVSRRITENLQIYSNTKKRIYLWYRRIWSLIGFPDNRFLRSSISGSTLLIWTSKYMLRYKVHMTCKTRLHSSTG